MLADNTGQQPFAVLDTAVAVVGCFFVAAADAHHGLLMAADAFAAVEEAAAVHESA